MYFPLYLFSQLREVLLTSLDIGNILKHTLMQLKVSKIHVLTDSRLIIDLKQSAVPLYTGFAKFCVWSRTCEPTPIHYDQTKKQSTF